MMTKADQAPIEQSRKSEEYQQGAAEERRKAFTQAMQQAEESQLLDNALSVKVEATRKAADEVKTKSLAAQTAEQDAKAAAVERQIFEGEVDSKTKAAELKARELADAQAAQQDAEIEREQKKSAANNSTDPGLQEALKLADETLKAAQDAVANADTASKEATRQKEDAERKLAAARTAEAEARKKASEAREIEAAALAVWEKTQGELRFLRSRLCQPLRFRDKVTPEMAIKLGFILVGLLGLWFLYNLASKDFLDLIESIDVARGLITFLVAISAITLAIILSLYPITASDDGTPLKERFGLSKEIFMVFVGILGTIIGFYFASDRDGNGRAEPPPAFLSFDLSEAHPGDKVKFTSLMYTGKAPFSWEISSEPKGIADRKGRQGVRVLEVRIAAALT